MHARIIFHTLVTLRGIQRHLPRPVEHLFSAGCGAPPGESRRVTAHPEPRRADTAFRYRPCCFDSQKLFRRQDRISCRRSCAGTAWLPGRRVRRRVFCRDPGLGELPGTAGGSLSRKGPEEGREEIAPVHASGGAFFAIGEREPASFRSPISCRVTFLPRVLFQARQPMRAWRAPLREEGRIAGRLSGAGSSGCGGGGRKRGSSR